MPVGIGEEFQENTKHSRERLLSGYLDWSNKPETYKNYPSAKKISLSQVFPVESLSLVKVLKKRRSVRSFSPKPLSLDVLSFLLWASTGIQRTERGYEYRTVPSAGALYPVETYLVVNNVEDLENALYHYSVEEHALEELNTGDFGEKVAHAALEQKMCLNAQLVLIWTAVFARSKWKYAQRAYRYVYLEVGHMAQNLAVAATGIGLGSCQIGAFFDDEVNQILGVDGKEESAIYLSAIGHLR
ncbi:MAG: SagB/ThcOx family dehydrogenase [Candidatus Bathyarchaeia archaeon]|nr:SagB/ThcOx family dehydrogenase [Candidatus Bathyarchaeia archaeon]